jgi:hypothetical protein
LTGSETLFAQSSVTVQEEHGTGGLGGSGATAAALGGAAGYNHEAGNAANNGDAGAAGSSSAFLGEAGQTGQSPVLVNGLLTHAANPKGGQSGGGSLPSVASPDSVNKGAGAQNGYSNSDATLVTIKLGAGLGGSGGGGGQGSGGGQGGEGATAALPSGNLNIWTVGANALAGASGNSGGDGVAGTAGDGLRYDFAQVTLVSDALAISAGGGGWGGDGGDSGNLGLAGTTHHASSLGGAGGLGGKGGQGAAGGDGGAAVALFGARVTVNNSVSLQSGNGGAGGDGGANRDFALGAGNGGAAGVGGALSVSFNQGLVANSAVAIAAGLGGNGGVGGNNAYSANAAGDGGAAGAGGAMSFDVANDLVLNATLFSFSSGSGGTSGAAGTGANPAAGGLAAAGGAATGTVARDFLVTQSATLDFSKGLANDGGAGALRFTVGRNLEIASGQSVTLDNLASGPMAAGADAIVFPTLFLRAGSALTSGSAEVFSGANVPVAASFYRVDSLDIIGGASWNMAGTFAPMTPKTGYIRFDLQGVAPNARLLTQAGAGTVSLDEFYPMAQHEAYLKSPNKPLYADDPAYRTYKDSFDAPAFLTSPYRTLRLSLGRLTLLEKTSGAPDASVSYLDGAKNIHYVSGNSSLGSLYNDFAFTAGLRRYYFDVYQEAPGGARQALIAHNYYTADASHIYAESAAAAAVAATQTFQSTLETIETAFARGNVGKVSVNAVFGGSHLRVDTGSHVDVSGWSGALAVSTKLEHRSGVTALGLFTEFGTGDYDTHAFIPRYGNVTGDGDVRSFGGGFFLKTLFNQNTFVEASARAGNVRNDFRLTRDPWTARPGIHSAKSHSSYWGAHLGVGQKFDLNRETSLDAYGKYFWTHTPGDGFVTGAGDSISIDSFNSSKIRLGARLTRQISETSVSFYAGLAGEREFSGSLSGANGPDRFAHGVDMSGNSAFGELGLNVNPAESVSLSLGAFGWAGERRGGGGAASLRFSF